ncbi:RNA polymerase III [Sarcoptes scabiei]|nr:RNA polymerase III [Sarcoptes scabiei]
MMMKRDSRDSTTIDSITLSKSFENERMISTVIKSIVDYASKGFKYGLEASVRGIFKKPMTAVTAAVSMVIGVVAMLAFFESPISPLPVPPLPDPPVGRFPPEHPNWPPRTDRIQYYPKRVGSFSMPYNIGDYSTSAASSQPQSQLHFPNSPIYRSDNRINVVHHTNNPSPIVSQNSPQIDLNSNKKFPTSSIESPYNPESSIANKFIPNRSNDHPNHRLSADNYQLHPKLSSNQTNLSSN